MKRSLLICLAILAMVPSNGYGDFTYSNLGPNDEFDQFQGFLVGTFPDQGIENAHTGFNFTAEVTGTIQSIDVAVSEFSSGQQDSMIFTLWNDSDGLPGDALWVGATTAGQNAELVNVQAADFQGQTVTAGEQYWLSARANNGTGTFVWFTNSEGIESDLIFDPTGGSNWQQPFPGFPQGAMRINIDAETIPEPGFVLPLVAFGLFTTRRRAR